MPGPDAPALAVDHVHVWRVSLLGAAASERLLSREDQDRAEQMSAANARQAFVVTRSALRELISRYENVDAAAIQFAAGEHGKPRVVHPESTIEFNVSHSGDWAVIAISRGLPLGVDVEQVRPDRPQAELAKRFMVTGEHAALRLPDAKEGVRFFQLWARKEAYLKAIGTGLATGFSRVDATRDGLPDLLPTGEPASSTPVWFAAPFMVDDNHPACVVARSATFSLQLYDFDKLAP